MRNLFAVAILFSALLTACHKANVNDQTTMGTADTKVKTDFTGRPLKEVLELKYNSAILRCELWSQASSKIVTSGAPNDSLAVDLKTFKVPSTYTLKAQIQNHYVEVQIQIVGAVVDAKVTSQPEGAKGYSALFTPRLSVDANFKAMTTYVEGTSNTGPSEAQNEIVEKNKSTLFSLSGSGIASSDTAFSDLADCYIETDIKPDYQDQYKEI